MPASVSGDDPTMMASAVHACGSLAMQAGPACSVAILRVTKNRHRIDIAGRRWFGQLIAGYRDDAKRMAAQIIEINDPSICTLYIELRHRRRMLPFAGALHRIAGIVCAQIVDQIPTCLARQCGSEAGHRVAPSGASKPCERTRTTHRRYAPRSVRPSDRPAASGSDLAAGRRRVLPRHDRQRSSRRTASRRARSRSPRIRSGEV